MKRPLIFGEVLFDHFPDHTVLGGAPFNVAWNLQGFGLNPLILTAIGADEQGISVRQRMQQWKMDTAGLQVSPDHPTGRVDVEVRDGQPRFELAGNQAYDFIQTPSVEINTETFALIYHGTLAWRSEQSRSTLSEVISSHSLPRFVDINIRKPHFDVEWLAQLLPEASWIKVNDDELSSLAKQSTKTDDEIRAAVKTLCNRYGKAIYFVTAGARGAYVVDGEEIFFRPAPTPESFKDTVGAGDAFSAMTIEGLIRGREIGETLGRATKFAAKICGVAGATSDDTSLYHS